MDEAVYAIDAFPDDDLLWRIEWIGGVGHNMSVPSDPLIDVCLARIPDGETYPLSERSRSAQTKRTVKISIGLLPYISIASVWQKQRPVATDLDTYRHRLHIDTSSCRTVALGELASSANAIPRRSYLFGASWRYVRRTLLVAVEQHGDPYAVMVPTATVLGPRSPWPGGVCAASSTRSHTGKDRVVAVEVRRTRHACRWSSNMPPRTNGSAGS